MAALALAERLDMPRLASDIRTTLVGLERSVSPEAIVEALRAAIDQASAAGADNAELRGLLLLGHHHLDRGEFALADEVFEEATIRGREAGTPWIPFAAEARWSHAMSLSSRAGGTRRCACSTSSATSPPPIYHALFTATRADILAARGDSTRGRPGARPARVLAARGPDRDHRRHRRARPARPGR